MTLKVGDQGTIRGYPARVVATDLKGGSPLVIAVETQTKNEEYIVLRDKNGETKTGSGYFIKTRPKQQFNLYKNNTRMSGGWLSPDVALRIRSKARNYLVAIGYLEAEIDDDKNIILETIMFHKKEEIEE